MVWVGSFFVRLKYYYKFRFKPEFWNDTWNSYLRGEFCNSIDTIGTNVFKEICPYCFPIFHRFEYNLDVVWSKLWNQHRSTFTFFKGFFEFPLYLWFFEFIWFNVKYLVNNTWYGICCDISTFPWRVGGSPAF